MELSSRRLSRRAVLLAAFVLAVGCTPAAIRSPTGTAPSSPSASIPGSPGSAAPETGPPVGSNASPADGHVVIVLEREQYAPGESIVLSVSNGLPDPITTVDQQAFCDVLRLDMEVGAGWEEVRNCISGPPPRDVVIEPGAQRTVTWEQGLGEGVYRARLVYTIGTVFVAGEALEVISGRLTVG
jgi:hypothetical protein